MMSERFKVTKSEDPNPFPNYGATGNDTDDSHGKLTAESDAKRPSSSLEDAIGRGGNSKSLVLSLACTASMHK